MQYRYRSVSSNPAAPLAPVVRARLYAPDVDGDRFHSVEAIFDTGAEATLVPLEAIAACGLPLLGTEVSVMGLGTAVTKGFPCHAFLLIGEMNLTLIKVIACEAAAIGGTDRMIIGRNILARFCVRFDGQRQEFSFG